MDYILTTVLFVIGVLFHVMQQVRQLRIKFPEFSFARIWKTFMAEEWDSLCVSFLVWLVYELTLYIIRVNETAIPQWVETWGMYALALTLGYCGQRLAYRYLGTAEKVLQKKVDDISKLN